MRNIFAYRTWLDRSWSFFRAQIFIVVSLWKECHQIWSLSFDCEISWTSSFITSQSQNLLWVWPNVEIREQKKGNFKNKKKLTMWSGKSAGTKVVCGKCPSGDETRAARAFDLRKDPKCFQSSIVYFSSNQHLMYKQQVLIQIIVYSKDAGKMRAELKH